MSTNNNCNSSTIVENSISSGSENSANSRRRRGRPPGNSSSKNGARCNGGGSGVNEIAYTTNRRTNITKSLDASSSFNKNDSGDDNSSVNSGVTAARPAYTSRGESMARPPHSHSETAPAFARAQQQQQIRSISPPPLPPAMFSGTFDVPTSTPHVSQQNNTNGLRIVSPSRNPGNDRTTTTTSSIAHIPSNVMCARQQNALSSSSSQTTPMNQNLLGCHQSSNSGTGTPVQQTSVQNPPSVTVREDEYRNYHHHQSLEAGNSTVKIENPSANSSWFNSTPVVGSGDERAYSNSHHQNNQNNNLLGLQQSNNIQRPPLNYQHQQPQQNTHQHHHQQNLSSYTNNNQTHYVNGNQNHHRGGGGGQTSQINGNPFYTQQHQQQNTYQQPSSHSQQYHHPMAIAQSPSTARLINAPSRSPGGGGGGGYRAGTMTQQPSTSQANSIQRIYGNNNINNNGGITARGASVSQAPYYTHRGYYGDVHPNNNNNTSTTGGNRQESLTNRPNVAAAPSSAVGTRTSSRQNYSEMTPELQSESRKKLFDKFLILQRSFPAWNIPLPSDESSLDMIHDLYESYVKQITIHSNSTQYKILLVIMFIGIEFASSRFGVDLGGYAEMQIRSMHRYEGVLLELGEKYTSEGGGEMPVEARIFMLALIQAGIFFVAKYVEKWTGAKGMSRIVHSLMDGMIDQVPGISGGEGNGGSGPRLDAQGFQMAPGTEDAIAAVDDDDVNAAIAAASGGGNASSSSSNQSSSMRSPIDLGGMLSGLFGGGGSPLGAALGGALGGGNGGGGLDVANLVGTAMKFINHTPNLGGGNEQTSSKNKTSPQRGVASPKSPPVRVSPQSSTAGGGGGGATSPSGVSQTSPGRSGIPRKAPVFTE